MSTIMKPQDQRLLELRSMQNYSSVARWKVRAAELENESDKLQMWDSPSSKSSPSSSPRDLLIRSIVDSDGLILPADFQLDLLTPTATITNNNVDEWCCDCDLCPQKRDFQASLLELNESIKEYQASSSSLSRCRCIQGEQRMQKLVRNDSNHCLLAIMDVDVDDDDDDDACFEFGDSESTSSQFAAAATVTGVFDDRSQDDASSKHTKMDTITPNSVNSESVAASDDAEKPPTSAAPAPAPATIISKETSVLIDDDDAHKNKVKILEEMDAVIAAKEVKILEENAEIVSCKAKLVAMDAECVATRHQIVHDRVLGLIFYGNMRSSTSASLPSFHESNESMDDDRISRVTRLDMSIVVFNEGCYPKLVVEDASDELKAFHAWLIHHASALKKPTRMIHRLRNVTKSKKAKAAAAVLEILDWDVNAKNSMSIPLQVLGKDCCRQILGAIMYRIASMESCTVSDSPVTAARLARRPRKPVGNNNMSPERAFWRRKENRTTRPIDFVVPAVEEWLRPVLACSCLVPIKVKRRLMMTSGKRVNLAKLHLKAAYRVVGHLADQIHNYLHLGGIGRNHICRGVVLTLVSVEIIEMELMGIGTKKVKVETRTSKPHFLFDKTTTMRLLKSKYKASSDFQFDESHPFRGLELLAAALRCPSNDEGSPLPVFTDPINSTERPLEEYLGAGGFGFVHKLDDGHFVKIPNSPDDRERLENEGKTLRQLQGWGDALATKKFPYIPDSPYPELGMVHFRRCCERSELPALCIAGVVGTAASMWKDFTTNQLTQILENVKQALVYAHNKSIVHLDVRPSNIIIGTAATATTAGFTVQLGDWGCAKSIGAEVNGIRGSIPFAHDEILTHPKSSSWTTKAMHDFASLTFTMAVLITIMNGVHDNHHQMPWMEFWRMEENELFISERRVMCRNIIARSSLPKADKIFLLRNIGVKRFGMFFGF